MRACSHEGCIALLFPWDIENEDECRFKRSECTFCEGMFSKASIKHHFKEDCQVHWINESDPEKDGSSSMIEFCRKASKGFQIELDSIKTSFVVIRSDQVITFKSGENNYEVGITQLSSDTSRTDITYWLPNENTSFDQYTTISMKPEDSNECSQLFPSNLWICYYIAEVIPIEESRMAWIDSFNSYWIQE
jgi:hypothetical protein